MTINIPHHWLHPPSLKEAAEIQREMAAKVILEDDFGNIQHWGGMDVSNNPYDPQRMIYAVAITLNPDNWQVTAQASHAEQQKFPYVPGFLGFREAPALVTAFNQLAIKPQLILVDGHGISHPRGLGIASHIGVLLNTPTIGVAKSILVGKPANIIEQEVGAQTPLVWKDKTIGVLLRTKARCNPLIISPGHRISFPTAVKLVQQALRGYRLPEPTRHAHLTANVYRKNFMQTLEISTLA